MKQQTKDFIRTVAAAGLSTLVVNTYSHPMLKRVPKDVARREFTGGQYILRDKLQLPINYFCYPNGRTSDFDAAHVKLVQEAGFDCATSTVENLCNQQEDLYRLPRKNVGGQFTTAALDCKLTGLWWSAG